MTIVQQLRVDPFQSILSGQRRSEVLVDEPGFQVGDLVLFQEYDAQRLKHTGAWIRAKVTCVVRPSATPRLQEDQVLITFDVLHKGQAMCCR